MAKKPAEPKPKRLLDEVLEIQGRPSVRKWQVRLTSEQLEQLEEIREAVKQGQVTLSFAQVRDLVIERLGVSVGKSAFVEWMRA
jgi:hypothetical protein